jgi:hypothetical protein
MTRTRDAWTDFGIIVALFLGMPTAATLLIEVIGP